MPASTRRSLCTVAAALFLLAAVWLAGSVPGVQADTETLQAQGEMRWYKGNMHTHSLWSDGDDYLETIGLWYREHDYQFLVYTDHNILADKERWINVGKSKGNLKAYDKLKARFPGDWVVERQNAAGELEVKLKTFAEVYERLAQPGEFLPIQGEEVSDSFGKAPIHMNASNVQELVIPRHGTSVADTIQNNTDAVLAQRERTGKPILVHLNHPNFVFGVTAEDLMRIRGENFFEVYNGHPTVFNEGTEIHSSTDRIWDIINTRRIAEFDLPLLYGLATDDGHSYHNIPSRAAEPGRGWVMVLANQLTPESLITAMEAGRFYASSGVTLSAVTTSAQGLEVNIAAEPEVTYRVEFIGTRKGFDPTATPVLDKEGKPVRATQRYSAEIGAVLATAEGPNAKYAFQGDELYIRARITASRKHPNPSVPGEFERAWTQPLRGPAAPPVTENLP